MCAFNRCTESRQAPGRVRLEVVTAGGNVRGGEGDLGAFEYELDLLCSSGESPTCVPDGLGPGPSGMAPTPPVDYAGPMVCRLSPP